jgi:membrane protein
MNKPARIFRNVIRSALKNDYSGLASEMAYNFILSLFPFIIFAVALFGLLGTENAVSQIIAILSAIAPSETLEMLRSFLNDVVNVPGSELLSILGLVGALWASSRSILCTMKAVNLAYGIPETRSYLKINVIALLTVIILAFVLLLDINLNVFGTLLYESLIKKLMNIHLNVLWLRWPVTFFVFFGMTLVLYFFLPNIPVKRKSLLYSSACGALFFSVFWFFGSGLFSIYIENFGRYNVFYGTLGAFIILLVWLYYLSLILLIGGGLSSEIYKNVKFK